jgi:hypothetical protein
VWEGRWGRGRDLWGFRDGRVRGASARSEDQLGVGRLWGPNGAYFSGFGIRLGVCLARKRGVDRLRVRMYVLPVRVLSRLFRRLFLEKLMAAFDAGRLQFFGAHADLSARVAFAAFLTPLRTVEWVVYAKRPFGGPEAVLAYLARYTHRVAISNNRLTALRDGAVAFKWKDYRIKGRDRLKTMTLAAPEFIRRFLIHVLPNRFHRIRHYGLFASGARAQNIAQARRVARDGRADPSRRRP